jgi:prepilin-type N-terminal cleavage/methylation domain-containing protein
MKRHGFTLMEITIVIAIVGMVSLLGVRSYNQARQNQAVSATVGELVDRLETAHLFAQSNKKERSWGIANVTATDYELFSKDASGQYPEKRYALREPATFGTDFSLVFLPPGGGLAAAADIPILKKGIPEATVHINTQGVVTTSLP